MAVDYDWRLDSRNPNNRHGAWNEPQCEPAKIPDVELPAHRLRKLREARGMSKSELAKKAGIGAQTVTILETIWEPGVVEARDGNTYADKRNRWERTSVRTIHGLSQALGVSIGYLRHGLEPPILGDTAAYDQQIVELSDQLEFVREENARLRKQLTRVLRLVRTAIDGVKVDPDDATDE